MFKSNSFRLGSASLYNSLDKTNLELARESTVASRSKSKLVKWTVSNRSPDALVSSTIARPGLLCRLIPEEDDHLR